MEHFQKSVVFYLIKNGRNETFSGLDVGLEENGMRKKRVTTSARRGKLVPQKKIRYERVECIIIARLFPLGSCACVG